MKIDRFLNRIPFFKRLQKSVFLKNTIFLQIGSVFYLGIAFISSIVYARVLGVEGYAIYGLIFAYVGLATIPMSLGTVDSTLTLLASAHEEANEKKIKDYLSYYLKITLSISLFIGVILMIVSPFIAARLYLNGAIIGKLAAIIILSKIILIFYDVYLIILQAANKIKKVAIIEAVEKIIYLIFPITLVLLGFGLNGLIFGQLLAASTLSIYAIFAYSRIKKTYDFYPTWLDIIYNHSRVSLRYYVKFSILIAVNKNIGSIMSNLPIFLLGIIASINNVGYFKIAFAYTALSSFVLSPVSRMLNIQFPKSKTISKRNFKIQFYKISLLSGLINILILIPMLILAPFLIKTFYGQEYIPSIAISYPLSLYFAISGFMVGSGAFYRAANLMKQSILINIAQSIVFIPMIFGLSRLTDPLTATTTSLISMAALFALINFWIIQKYFKE